MPLSLLPLLPPGGDSLFLFSFVQMHPSRLVISTPAGHSGPERPESAADVGISREPDGGLEGVSRPARVGNLPPESQSRHRRADLDASRRFARGPGGLSGRLRAGGARFRAGPPPA